MNESESQNFKLEKIKQGCMVYLPRPCLILGKGKYRVKQEGDSIRFEISNSKYDFKIQDVVDVLQNIYLVGD